MTDQKRRVQSAERSGGTDDGKEESESESESESVAVAVAVIDW